jgi:cytochrome o ubiquinol oxidase operon protein cyoD
MSDAESGHEFDAGDSAPGESGSAARDALNYLFGLVLASGLTVLSFYFAGSELIWKPAIPAALIALAIAQIGIHLVFFLHLTTAPDNTNNVLALAFGVLIVFLVVGGSVWIMSHLNYNMMPMERMLQMQR